MQNIYRINKNSNTSKQLPYSNLNLIHIDNELNTSSIPIKNKTFPLSTVLTPKNISNLSGLWSSKSRPMV